MQRLVDGLQIVPIGDPVHMPPVGFEALRHIFGKGKLRTAVNGNTVVVVQKNEFAQSEVSGQRRRLMRDALHKISIRAYAIREMVNDLEAGLVETRGKMLFGHGHAHGISESLTQRPGRRLNTLCKKVFRVTGRDAAPLPKLFNLLHRHGITGEVQHTVKQHGAMSGGEHEAVPIEPVRVSGAMLHVALPKHIGHGCSAHGHTGVSAASRLHGIDGEKAQGVDRKAGKVFARRNRWRKWGTH